jgi:hypothetical protein
MTFRYCAPGVYTCDRCATIEYGNSDRPPYGWATRFNEQEGKVEHVCPRCVEEAKRA